MIRIFFFLTIMFSLFSKASANYSNLAYDYSFNNIDGDIIKLSDYRDQIIVVVNVASRCGYTPQYEGLQKLWENYKNMGLVVIGIPTNNFKQEPGSNKEIKDFCQTNFGIDFPMTEKINVIGKDAHPFFLWAKNNHGIGAIPKWNFHKIIIGKKGKVLDTFASFTKPSSDKFIKIIEKEIKN